MSCREIKISYLILTCHGCTSKLLQTWLRRKFTQKLRPNASTLGNGEHWTWGRRWRPESLWVLRRPYGDSWCGRSARHLFLDVVYSYLISWLKIVQIQCGHQITVHSKVVQRVLEGYKAKWNFIQSFFRMCVEWICFGILKRSWKIIMEKAGISLWHIIDTVTKCIFLHSLCTIRK